MKLFFWLCLVGGAYSYVLYPLLLLVLPRARRSAVTPTSAVRRISLVIAARNEAAKIVAKLENTLALQRLEGVELEVIVASDASDDGTDDIVASYGTGVKLARAARVCKIAVVADDTRIGNRAHSVPHAVERSAEIARHLLVPVRADLAARGEE